MQPWWAFFFLTSNGSVCLAQTIPLTGNTSNAAIMLIWLYKMFYLMSFYTQTSVQKPLSYMAEHVRVGCNPVGLSWTRFSSLLKAFVYGFSHKPGSFQPSQTCSSDSLVSNEPPRWLLKKTKKTGTSSLSHSIFHFPLTQTKETLLCSNSHDAPMLHLFILLMSCPGVPQTTRAFLSFSNTFIFLYPFFSCHLFLFFRRSPALALLTHAPPYSSAFVSLKLV